MTKILVVTNTLVRVAPVLNFFLMLGWIFYTNFTRASAVRDNGEGPKRL